MASIKKSDLPPDWLKESWANAKRNGTDKLTMKEINAEIAASRRERRPKPLNKLIDEGLASAARREFVDGKEALMKLRRREHEMALLEERQNKRRNRVADDMKRIKNRRRKGIKNVP